MTDLEVITGYKVIVDRANIEKEWIDRAKKKRNDRSNTDSFYLDERMRQYERYQEDIPRFESIIAKLPTEEMQTIIRKYYKERYDENGDKYTDQRIGDELYLSHTTVTKLRNKALSIIEKDESEEHSTVRTRGASDLKDIDIVTDYKCAMYEVEAIIDTVSKFEWIFQDCPSSTEFDDFLTYERYNYKKKYAMYGRFDEIVDRLQDPLMQEIVQLYYKGIKYKSDEKIADYLKMDRVTVTRTRERALEIIKG